MIPFRPILLAAVLASAPAAVATHGAEGQSIVREACAECHATGLHGAPTIGDRRAWAPRAARGLSSLTTAAMEGVRKMPAHGGRMQFDDVDLRRAITSMVNQSGGRWTEPLDPAKPPRQRTGAQVVATQCAQCHGTGAAGAPRIGDRDAWIGRARGGLPSLVRSAIHGHGAMPARGGLADLTDGEVEAAVSHMVRVSIGNRK